MALAYRPPNVTATETVTPSTSSLIADAANVCIVGLSQGYETRTDQFILTGTSAIPLPGLPTGAAVVGGTPLFGITSVIDALDPSKGNVNGTGYTQSTDWVATAGTIARVGGGTITDGALVNVTYKYAPADYYDPITLDSLGAVASRFGEGLNSTRTAISSILTYAAGLAFENGAAAVTCQPLFKRTTPGDHSSVRLQPDDAQAATLSTWQDTIYLLRDYSNLNLFVPAVGQSATSVTDAVQLTIFQAFQDHLSWLKSTEQYGIAILGEDSTDGDATKATIRSHATSLQGRYGGALSEQLVLIAPGKFTVPTTSGQSLAVGGQYAAAALAGAIASRPVSSGLTRKVISGLATVGELRNTADKNTDAAAGILVLENDKGNVRCRHSVTLDNTATARRELSVVRSKHRVVESVRDTIDSQIIGQIIADDNAPNTVKSVITNVLEALQQTRDIVGYKGVEARLLSLEPTTIQARFSYRPAFPLNYVDIVFSLDLTSNVITVV